MRSRWKPRPMFTSKFALLQDALLRLQPTMGGNPSWSVAKHPPTYPSNTQQSLWWHKMVYSQGAGERRQNPGWERQWTGILQSWLLGNKSCLSLCCGCLLTSNPLSIELYCSIRSNEELFDIYRGRHSKQLCRPSSPGLQSQHLSCVSTQIAPMQ